MRDNNSKNWLIEGQEVT